MSSNADYFLKKNLGEDFFESLQKFELWKPGTRTTIDHEEIRTALMIVPKTIIALLSRELSSMDIGESKEVKLFIQNNKDNILRATKHENDVYSGDIVSDNKVVVDFKYRSIPGIGLIIMSAFELYNTSELTEESSHKTSHEAEDKIQHMIEQRLALHDLINKVVDKKLTEREAVNKLILLKLTETMKKDTPKEESQILEKKSEIKNKKTLPLKEFLDKRDNKLKKNEFSVQITKNENIKCPDCGKNIFDGTNFSGCVCYGEDMDKKLFIKKTEEGIKIRFGKGWDSENIEMLLEVLRRKRG